MNSKNAQEPAGPALRLTLTPRHLQAVRMHAASVFPEECCGFLLGVAEEGGGAEVHRILAARNEHPDRRRDRFLIAPETVLAARREARAQGFEVIGYYHSHTDGTAEPSEHDRRDAWPATSYLIVPVDEGAAGPPRSWRLREDRAGFVEEIVQTAGNGSTAPLGSMACAEAAVEPDSPTADRSPGAAS